MQASECRIVLEDAPRRLPGSEHREVHRVEPNKEGDKVDFPEEFVVHFPGHLGEPVVQPPEERGCAAEHHVVEVCDHPVCAPELVIKNDRTEEHPSDAAEDEQ